MTRTTPVNKPLISTLKEPPDYSYLHATPLQAHSWLRSDTPTPSSAKLPLQHLEHRRRVAVIGLELDRHPQ